MSVSVPAFAKKDKFAVFRSADPPAYHVPVRHILSLFENRIKGNNGYFPKLVGLFGYERNFSFKETLFFW